MKWTSKQLKLLNLEERIGRLSVHSGNDCHIQSLWDDEIFNMSDLKLDRAIAERLSWLRDNNEKEHMGG